MTTIPDQPAVPEPMPGEDPGVPPDEQEPEVTPLDPGAPPETIPATAPEPA